MCTYFQTRKARVIELLTTRNEKRDVLVNPVACLMIGGRSPHSLRFPFPCPPSNGSARPLPTTALPASPSIAHRTAPTPPPSKQRYKAPSHRSLHPTALSSPSLVDMTGFFVHPILIQRRRDSSHLAVLATIATLRQRISNGQCGEFSSSVHLSGGFFIELVNCFSEVQGSFANSFVQDESLVPGVHI